MADMIAVGGGDRGAFLEIDCVPDSTFKTEIDALITAGTYVVGKMVSFTYSNNYEVTSPADNARIDGQIIGYRKTTGASGNNYILTIRVYHYVDQNSAHHTPVGIATLEYASGATIALQDTVQLNGSDYRDVDDGGTDGWGAVIAIYTTNLKVDVLF